MHFTYAIPGTAEAYRRTRKFPDGTVLVKEVFGTEHAEMTTGDASWASGTKVWFVLIKDAKGRYPGNPLWAMGGVGHSSRPTHLTSRWRPTTKKTALAVTSPLSRQTGSTYKAIRFSNQNEEGHRRKP